MEKLEIKTESESLTIISVLNKKIKEALDNGAKAYLSLSNLETKQSASDDVWVNYEPTGTISITIDIVYL